MNESIDRISSLPDDVLTHILSFVSTKEAVQTCILAKRWRTIWASVPVLCFYLDEFWKMNDGQEGERGDNSGGDDDYDYDEEQRISEEWFKRFVDGVLENRRPSDVEKVIYSWRCEPFYGFSPINTYEPYMDFLDRIVLLMPREIITYIHIAAPSLEPDSVFSCASLQKLIMHVSSDYCLVILAPNSINLPYLKTLELNNVSIYDDFGGDLFLGCPALESLKLDNCDIYFSAISFSMLKILILHGCILSQALQISCPALISLLIDNVNQEEGSISLKNMKSLVNADVTILGGDYSFHSLVLNFLCGLSNATSLKLHVSGRKLEEQLDECIPSFRTFTNLKCLDIGALGIENNFDLVACFLNNSPYLDSLNLRLYEGIWGKVIPSFRTFDNLKSLKISAKYMISNLNLVACFLNSSPNLRELTLRLNYSYYGEHEEPIPDVVGDHLFQIQYLETLKLYGDREVAGKMVSLLCRCIKTIGNIIHCR